MTDNSHPNYQNYNLQYLESGPSSRVLLVLDQPTKLEVAPTVRLFRKESGSKGAKIGIVFHCQDTEDDVKFDENDYINEDGLINDAGEEDDEPAQAVRFGVVVSKGGSTVVMQCRAGSEGEVSVESVMVRDGDTESVLNELAGGEGLHHALYQVSEFGICIAFAY